MLFRIFFHTLSLFFQGTQLNQPIFAKSTSGRTASTIFSTLSTVAGLIVLIMGGLFIFKRFYSKPNLDISMHFERPRAAMGAARVKMGKLNEIMINRNNNNHKPSDMAPATMFEEQETNDLNSLGALDDTHHLLP